MVVVIDNESRVLYSYTTESRALSIHHVRDTFGLEVSAVKEPQALVLVDKSYVVMFKTTIPEHLHIKEEYRNANIYVLDDFIHYADKVKSYYASFSKDELFQELLKYRINEVVNGDVGSII
jgi:hypothetical protein